MEHTTQFHSVRPALVYQVPFNIPFGETSASFNTVYNAAPGRYRFVVSAANFGAGSVGAHGCGAEVTLTLPIPAPAATPLLAVGAAITLRRRRA